MKFLTEERKEHGGSRSRCVGECFGRNLAQGIRGCFSLCGDRGGQCLYQERRCRAGFRSKSSDGIDGEDSDLVTMLVGGRFEGRDHRIGFYSKVAKKSRCARGHERILIFKTVNERPDACGSVSVKGLFFGEDLGEKHASGRWEVRERKTVYQNRNAQVSQLPQREDCPVSGEVIVGVGALHEPRKFRDCRRSVASKRAEGFLCGIRAEYLVRSYQPISEYGLLENGREVSAELSKALVLLVGEPLEQIRQSVGADCVDGDLRLLFGPRVTFSYQGTIDQDPGGEVPSFVAWLLISMHCEENTGTQEQGQSR